MFGVMEGNTGGVGGEVDEEVARYFIAIVLCIVAASHGVWIVLCCGQLLWGGGHPDSKRVSVKYALRNSTS